MKPDRDQLHLAHILEAGDAILDYTGGGHDAFVGSRMVRDAVVRNLEVIGEAAKRLSEAVRAANPEVPWRRIAGLRDIIIHQYDSVDYEELWRVVEDELPPFLEAVRRILRQRERGRP